MERVRRRIEAACERSGRLPTEVSVVAVSKTFGPDDVRGAVEAGLTVFGESRVQEARQKIPLCPGHLTWHMVGHVQRNKARDAVRLFRMVHSADSGRLLETLDAACEAAGVSLPVCLEINVSGEGSKFGLKMEETPEVLGRCSALSRIEVAGLMTVPPFTPDPADARPHFRHLRELRDRWRDETGLPLRELSMGMSHDFEVAVEEGATLVRLGAAIFGERRRPAPAPEDS
jgi:hypothetical protein